MVIVPGRVEVLGGQAELDDEVAGEVLRPDLASLLLPQLGQGLLVLAHDPGVGASDEVPSFK